MRILVVDDDADDWYTLTAVVDKLDLQVHPLHAKDHTELFDHLEKHHETGFNMILMDINMPRKNGKQCLKELKSNERYRHIPVVMYSVSTNEQDIDESFEHGAHLYVVKPYSHVNFSETIKKVFDIDWTSEQPIPSREDFVINMTFT